MWKSTKSLLIALIAWDSIVACWIIGMHIWVRSMSVGPEEKQALIFAFIVGCAVVVLCWILRRMLRPIVRFLAGLALGLVIPIAAGWVWGRLPEYSPGLPWSFLEAWGAGLNLALPSAVAGGIVSLLQAERMPDSSAE